MEETTDKIHKNVKDSTKFKIPDLNTKSFLGVLKNFSPTPISFDRLFKINSKGLLDSQYIPDDIKKLLKITNTRDLLNYIESLSSDVKVDKNIKSSIHDPETYINNGVKNNTKNSDKETDFVINNNGKTNIITYNDITNNKNRKIQELISKNKDIYMNDVLDDVHITLDDFDLSDTNTKTFTRRFLDEHEAYCGWFLNNEDLNGNNNFSKGIYMETPITNTYDYVYNKGIKGNKEPIVKYNNIKVVKKYYSPFIKMIKNAEFDGINLKLLKSFESFEDQLNNRRNKLKPIHNSKLDDDFWLYESEQDNFYEYVEKPGWGSCIKGNTFVFETNNGFSSSYKWLVKYAINYGFIRTNSKNTDVWSYKPTDFDYNNPFLYVKENVDNWLGYQYDMYYTPVDNEEGESFTNVLVSNILEVDTFNNSNIEKCKNITKNKLIKLIEHLPNYKDLSLVYKLEQKTINNKNILICHYKTKEKI